MRHRLNIIPYQEAPSPPMTPELYQACDLAVHVVTSRGQVLRAGRAVLFTLQELGYPVSWLNCRPWILLVEAAYRIAANHRPFLSRFFFRRE